MLITDIINSTIDRFPKGFVFTYLDFEIPANKQEAAIKSLSRLVAAGKISKISKGKYYKPEISEFGALLPSQYQVVKDLLEKNGNIVGYITGYNAYNELGLSTQISNVIQIGKNEIRSAFSRGFYKIAFIKQKNKITKTNIPLLKILDCIRFIKVIPDTTIDNSCIRLTSIINGLCPIEQESLIKLALNYPPSTIAVLGALLENFVDKNKLEPLIRALNPITTYKLNVSEGVLPNAKNWNII